MRLEDIESEQQMLDVLEEGDVELEEEIEKEVKWAVERAYNYAETENPLEWMTTRDMTVVVLNATNDGVDVWGASDDVVDKLRGIPNETIKEAFQAIVWSAVERSSSPLQIELMDSSSADFKIYPVQDRLYVRFETPMAWVPDDVLLEALNDASWGESYWEEIGYSKDEKDFGGNVENDDTVFGLAYDLDDLYEWAIDVRNEYFSEMVDADPEEAVKEFARLLQAGYPSLYEQVKKAKLPQDALAAYATAFFEDEEEGVALITEAMGDFGYEGTRGETILEADRDTLASIGIAKGGRFYDGAPWKLINLPPEELAYEGVLQRHCVGRHDMGYRQAVERGETQIWSLRSAANKPLITFEVDAQAWEAADTAQKRAKAIYQTKGKVNRLSGKDSDETKLMYWIFSQLDVDPSKVSDFDPADMRGEIPEEILAIAQAYPRAIANPRKRGRSFDQAWAPYSQRARKNPRRKAKKNPRKRGSKKMSPSLRKLLRGL